jgi:hypothetical protein
MAANVAPLALQRLGTYPDASQDSLYASEDVPTTKVISDRKVGGSDGTRTRGLLRDRQAF